MFLVQVAADIFGNKLNFELAFPGRPAVQELHRAAETAFSNEIQLRRPAGVPPHPFRLNKIKVYNEDTGKWVDLRSESQMIDSCQCYAFQLENAWHKETQKEIPPAVRPPSSSLTPSAAAAAPASSSYAALPPASNTSTYGRADSSAYQPRHTTTSSARPSGVAPHNSSGPISGVPAGFTAVDATEDEKLRAVFAEFDVKNQRMIDQEDLVHGFRSLGFEFSSATIRDLFNKGDLNADGRISFSEFETFAKWYPIMMNCLFYRSRAFWEDKNMEREIEKEKEAVRQAEALVAQAEQAQRKAKEDEEDAQNRIMDAEGDARDRAQRQRDLAAQADQAERDREKAVRQKADCEHDVIAARDAERQVRAAQADHQREADKQDRRHQAAAQEAAKADDKVKQLEQLLADAKRAAERAHQSERACLADVETARAKERDAAKTADTMAREIPPKDERLKHAEANLSAMDDRMRELAVMQRENQREAEEAARRRDAADRASQGAAEHTARMADEVDKAKRAADERARIARQREDDLKEQQAARQRVSAEEQALVDQEIKLREQRESLENKESKLQADAGNFLGRLRANANVSSSRGPSHHRDPSGVRY